MSALDPTTRAAIRWCDENCVTSWDPEIEAEVTRHVPACDFFDPVLDDAPDVDDGLSDDEELMRDVPHPAGGLR